jgi:hypothetical protein
MLFYDIACQTRTPAAIASVDASNCYNRIAHAIASLIFQSFGVESTAVSAMLEMVQEMKFFLRTAYWDSKTFAGSSIKIKTQGLGQGNGASPAVWCVISNVIVWAHSAKGHGAISWHQCPLYAAACRLSSTSTIRTCYTLTWTPRSRLWKSTQPSSGPLRTGVAC